jgi:hypothetical protein
VVPISRGGGEIHYASLEYLNVSFLKRFRPPAYPSATIIEGIDARRQELIKGGVGGVDVLICPPSASLCFWAFRFAACIEVLA